MTVQEVQLMELDSLDKTQVKILMEVLKEAAKKIHTNQKILMIGLQQKSQQQPKEVWKGTYHALSWFVSLKDKKFPVVYFLGETQMELRQYLVEQTTFMTTKKISILS